MFFHHPKERPGDWLIIFATFICIWLESWWLFAASVFACTVLNLMIAKPPVRLPDPVPAPKPIRRSTQVHKYLRHKDYGFILWSKDAHPVWYIHIAHGFDRRGIVSGGFAAIGTDGVVCYGKSETANVACLPEDSNLLADQLGIEHE